MQETDYHDRFGGLGRLYGGDSLDRLRQAHVCVIGIGGVGSWTVEALARSGVGRLTLVDLDDICVTNINRQLHALDGQIGKFKVDAMAERVRLIHPDCEIQTRNEFFTPQSAESILGGDYNYVVDAIDAVAHKALLIAECRQRGLPIVTCGGAGGKRSAAAVQVDDLGFATNDRLLKMVRKRLRQEHGFSRDEKEPFGVRAVFSTENAVYPWADGQVCATPEPGSELRLNCDAGLGTATFVTGTFGFAAAGEVVSAIARGKLDQS